MKDTEPNPKPDSKWNRIFNAVPYFFAFTFPMYAILLIVCLIAIPKDVLPWHQPKPTPVSSNLTPAQVNSIVAQVKAAIGPTSSQNAPTDRITDVAKLTLDAGKERIDAMKETYDRLFSLIAAVAALLVFFGFKGLESFHNLKVKAQESLDTTKAFEQKAKDTAESLQKFLDERYAIDSKAEINVAQGMALREIADLYREVLAALGKEAVDIKPQYSQYLADSLIFLKKVTDEENANDQILSRAFSIQANVFARLGKYEKALESLEKAKVFNKTDAVQDHAQILDYNTACYACKYAQELKSGGEKKLSLKYERIALDSLKEALATSGLFHPATDPDFEHFRTTCNQEFAKIVNC